MSKGRISKYPMIIIENEFVKQRMKFKELVAKYGISEGLLVYYSKKGNWLEKRNKYYSQVEAVTASNQVEQGAKEQKSLIERLQTLLDLKLEAETKVFLSTKEQQACKVNNKDLMYLLNKSKDPVGELTKIIELLKGNATSRNIEVEPKEKQARFDRLKEFMQVN